MKKWSLVIHKTFLQFQLHKRLSVLFFLIFRCQISNRAQWRHYFFWSCEILETLQQSEKLVFSEKAANVWGQIAGYRNTQFIWTSLITGTSCFWIVQWCQLLWSNYNLMLFLMINQFFRQAKCQCEIRVHTGLYFKEHNSDFLKKPVLIVFMIKET
jgi:hypothetical protein